MPEVGGVKSDGPSCGVVGVLGVVGVEVPDFFLLERSRGVLDLDFSMSFDLVLSRSCVISSNDFNDGGRRLNVLFIPIQNKIKMHCVVMIMVLVNQYYRI